MELDSRFAGTALKDFIMDVEWRDTMNYAASVGDDNPAYFDDTQPGGVIAPPMFCEAATWRISERVRDFIDAPDFPFQLLMTQVHYSEHVEFYRPVVPGDRLTISGRVAAVLPHRAGTHVVIRYDATDRKGGPVFAMNTGVMLRGVKCAGGGAGQDDLPSLPPLPPTESHAWTAPLEISRLAPYIYDGCAKIFFPIHTSERFARSVGLPGIILQGTATLAMAVREIVNREADGDPRLLKTIACRFSGMAIPGTTISVRALFREETANEKILRFDVLNASGTKAVSHGFARIAPPDD
jgi:acyl dehydratase